MELNEVQLMAVNISKVLKTILNDRISSSKIYDLVDEPNHHSFKIGFTAYNYFYVVFQSVCGAYSVRKTVSACAWRAGWFHTVKEDRGIFPARSCMGQTRLSEGILCEYKSGNGAYADADDSGK